ncbi:MAG: hypothetical protein AB7F76_16570 [Parvibaculaceae bacterium]
MSRKLLIGALTVAALLAASGAQAATKMLTDSKGMTLYTFDKDKGSVSMCYDDCAKHWPPYLMHKGDKVAKHWGKSKRKDGSMQWTYNKHPLYYYDDDKKTGDMMGDGKGGAWHIVKQ